MRYMPSSAIQATRDGHRRSSIVVVVVTVSVWRRRRPTIVEAVKAGNVGAVRTLLAGAGRSESARDRRDDRAPLGRAFRQSGRRRSADQGRRQGAGRQSLWRDAAPARVHQRKRPDGRTSAERRRGSQHDDARRRYRVDDGGPRRERRRREGAREPRRQCQRSRNVERPDRGDVGGCRQQRRCCRGARRSWRRCPGPHQIQAGAAARQPVDLAADPSGTPTSPSRRGSPRCISRCAPERPTR